MLSLMKSKRFWMSLLMGIFGFGAGLIYNVVPLFEYTLDEMNYIWQEESARLLPMFAVSGAICCIVTFFAYYIGDYLKETMQLKVEKINKKSLIILIVSSIIIPLLIGVIDILTKNPDSFSFVSVYYTLINTSAGILYSAVLEEIWFRACFMCLMIYVFHKVFNKNSKDDKINNKYVIMGIVFSALFLFIFQLNTILNLYSFSFAILFRLVFVYLIPNLLYGGIYIKHGLKWSIIGHIIFILIHLGVMPFVVTLI